MNKVTIVTITKFPQIFAQLRASIDRFASGYRCIAVVDVSSNIGQHDLRGWEFVKISLPFNCGLNAGIAQHISWPDDVLYISDDVQLLHEGSVEELQRIAYLNEDIGTLSPRIGGLCGNHLQSWSGKEIRADYAISPREFVSVCLYWKRVAINEVGLMDPRYDKGGDDIDFSQRLRAAGWLAAVTPKVRVLHGFGQYNGSASFKLRQIDMDEANAEMTTRSHEKAWEENCRV